MQAAHWLFGIEESLDASRPIDALRQEIASALARFLDVPVPDETSEEESDAAVGKQPESVEHVTDADLPDQKVLGVRVRPPDSILASNAPLGMVPRIPT